jgi:hypothetical protein
MARKKRASAKEVAAGDWVKAIQPGTTPSGRFIKAGEKFQLEAGHQFTDTWMEHTDAPERPELDPEFLAEQERRDLATHELQDKARQGKFTVREVARTEDVEKDAKKE